MNPPSIESQNAGQVFLSLRGLILINLVDSGYRLSFRYLLGDESRLQDTQYSHLFFHLSLHPSILRAIRSFHIALKIKLILH